MKLQEFEYENGSLFVDADIYRGERGMTIYMDTRGAETISYEDACALDAGFMEFYESVYDMEWPND